MQSRKKEGEEEIHDTCKKCELDNVGRHTTDKKSLAQFRSLQD